ncbi:hypothetical protein QL093DRAFT_2268763 [Fusarium oxysporum]|nr:hypothetical protein QL093DRAFT_2268763 [Fusarium oxysporum]
MFCGLVHSRGVFSSLVLAAWSRLIYYFCTQCIIPFLVSLLFSYLHSVHAWCIRRVIFCSTVSQLGVGREGHER